MLEGFAVFTDAASVKTVSLYKILFKIFYSKSVDLWIGVSTLGIITDCYEESLSLIWNRFC
jgi:hypothetical protein